MYNNIRRNRKLSTILSGILIVCLSILGGYGGAKLYAFTVTAKEQEVIADSKREDIQEDTKDFLKTYSNLNKGSDTKSVIKQEDASEIAEKTATLVSTKLINSSISGLATKEEVQALENRVSDMFSSYELSDSQKEDLAKAVTAIIELDLNKLAKDSNAQTALSDAAYKNIDDLKAKANSIQEEIDGIKDKLKDITSDNNKIKETVDKGYATSDQTNTLQSKIDNLTKQYEDILSKYNNQTGKIQSLIENGTNSDSSEVLKEEITTLQATLSKLQESATSEISALEGRIEELRTSSTDTIIDELKSDMAEQQDQISTYKDNIQNLEQEITDLKTELKSLGEEDNDAREKLEQQIQDTNNLINQNQSDIESANANISDMEEEIGKLKNGTADSIGTLQNQIATITSSLTEMDATQKTLDDLLNNLKSTVGEEEIPGSGTIVSNLSSTQNALALLGGRVDELEAKTQNIKSGVKVPFSFGVENGEYGYYDANNSFVDFKSQSDIEGAVSDAIGNMTGTAERTKYTVTAQGTPKYKTDNIKNKFIVSLVGSENSEGNYVIKANGEDVYTIPKEIEAIGRNYYGGGRDSLTSPKINGVKRLPMADYKKENGGYNFPIGSEEMVTFPAGYYDSSISVSCAIKASGKFKATKRDMSIDMGQYSFYRYVDTRDVPNYNSRGYYFPSGSNGEKVDLGEDNNIRYVDAKNVFYSGKDSMMTDVDTWISVNGSSSLAISPYLTYKRTYKYIYIKKTDDSDVPLNSNDAIRLWSNSKDSAWGLRLRDKPITSGEDLGDGWYRFFVSGGMSVVELINNNTVPREYVYHFSD
ncbi:MAG: hypothetical protein J5504_03865 [Butyrivibrio sp.]|nr:hypothetical protein [Butyrivibrio sp.]